MSAFIVDKKQIDYILTAFENAKNRYTKNTFENKLTEIGQKLTDENYKSVNYRYNENTAVPVYKFERLIFSGTDNLQAIEYLSCLDYQSCECKNYYESEAKKIIDEIIITLAHDMTEGKNLKWCI